MTSLMMRIVAMIGVIVSSWASATLAGETINVRLTDGKTLKAELDARTDQDRLWLRFGGGTTIVLRPVPWRQVAGVEYRGQALPLADVRDLAESLQSDLARPSSASPVASSAQLVLSGASYADQARRFLGFRPRISTVQFDASLANWDQDVEADGLLVRVLPTDERGSQAVVQGVLDVELVAMKAVAFHQVPRSQGQPPRRLGRWTVRLDEEDFGTSGATVKLPFQASHPEFDTRWAAHGLVHLRLTVPGHGVFERSVDGVRIRPFAPLRDALERQQRSRFLPSEHTGRNR